MNNRQETCYNVVAKELFGVCPECDGRGYYNQKYPDCSNCEENATCDDSGKEECSVPTKCDSCNGSGINQKEKGNED